MPNEVHFTVVSPIVTKGRPRARVIKGKYAHIYTPDTTASYENLIKLEYAKQCKGHYFGEVPLIVSIEAKFGKNQELQKYGNHSTYIPCINQKDCDNIAKIILDALNGVAYKDDHQIWSINVCKIVNESSKDEIKVMIREEGRTIEEVKERVKAEKQHQDYLQLIELSKTKKLTKAQKERIAKYIEVYGNDREH